MSSFAAKVREARHLEKEALDYAGAVALYKEATLTCPDQKTRALLERKVHKLAKLLKASTGQWDDLMSADEDGYHHNPHTGSYHLPDVEVAADGSNESTDFNFALPAVLHDRLFPYQRAGVRWLWSLHNAGHGGILGDDMGLGKTFQTVSFLAALFSQKLVSRALVVAPVSLVAMWLKDLKQWIPKTRVLQFVGSMPPKQRAAALSEVARKGGVLVTTYDLLKTGQNRPLFVLGRPEGSGSGSSSAASAVDADGSAGASGGTGTGSGGSTVCSGGGGYYWDYVVLDEGHRIKNPATQVALLLLPATANQRHPLPALLPPPCCVLCAGLEGPLTTL
jgi:SNF2 family DNA or RNA helicase